VGGQGGGEYADPLEQWKCVRSARNSVRLSGGSAASVCGSVRQCVAACLVI
jgi:hypothetical protein